MEVILKLGDTYEFCDPACGRKSSSNNIKLDSLFI